MKDGRLAQGRVKGDPKGKAKLCVKGAVLVLCLIFAAFRPDLLTGFFTYPILFFRVYHLFWLAAVLILFKRMIPAFNRKPTSGKVFGRWYACGRTETPGMKERLGVYTRRMNRGALKTAFYWCLVILVTGALCRLGVFGPPGLFIVVVFFIFMDQFCVSLWCPFQWIIGHKCCLSCRINNWGYLMAFAPLIFFPNFWTLSVVTLSMVVVLQWEFLVFLHPERFFEVYNENLTCRSCTTPCAARLSRGAKPKSG